MILSMPIKEEFISSSKEAEKFVKIYLTNGQIDKIEKVTSRDELIGNVDLFVTPEKEEVLEFINEGAEPLLTPQKKMNIEDIVTAFIFRELYNYEM